MGIRPLPGSTHDLTAARIWGIVRELAASGLVILADKGYHGARGLVITPDRGRNKASITESAKPSTSCKPARSKDEKAQD